MDIIMMKYSRYIITIVDFIAKIRIIIHIAIRNARNYFPFAFFHAWNKGMNRSFTIITDRTIIEKNRSK